VTTTQVFTINRKPRSGSNGNRVHDPPESAFTMDRNTHHALDMVHGIRELQGRRGKGRGVRL